MKYTKENIRKRILQNGEPLSLDKFEWDENSRTFSTTESYLVLDFSDLHYITFKTRYNCTFKTGSYCTFNTDSDCTFKTGSECVVIRRDIFEVILLKENIQTTLCPYGIKGCLEEIDGKQYLNGKEEDGEYIIVDNILSKVINRKGSVIKVQNYSDTEESFIVEQDGIYSHGKTIAEARESIIYKLSNRDASAYKDLTLESVLTKKKKNEAIKMYMVITGSCSFGTKQFVDKQTDIKEEYSVQELIELTTGQYGNDKLKEFFCFKK